MTIGPVIGETFQSFYDPNSHFSGPFTLFGQRRLLRFLEKKRRLPIDAETPDGTVQYSGRELIALEMAHTMLISQSDYRAAAPLGLDEETLAQAVEVANFGAQQIVRGVKAAVELLLAENPELARLTEARDPHHLLTAGAVLAAVSHRGQKRRSGHDYIDHTIAAAGIAGIAARMEGEDFSTHERHVLRLLQYGLLNHDGFEDSMESSGKNRGRSFLASDKIVASPLVHYTLLKELGVSPEESFEEARNIYLLSKPVGPERKGRMKYDKYVDRFIDFIEVDVMKLCDIHHNLNIDPKRVRPVTLWHKLMLNRTLKLKSQQNNYSEVFASLEANVIESQADPMLKRVARNIRYVRPRHLDEWRMASMSVRILNQFDNKKLLHAWDKGQLDLAS